MSLAPSPSWLNDVAQLLDDHHLVVLSEETDHRRQCVGALGTMLGEMTRTEVVIIDGARTHSLSDFVSTLSDHRPLDTRPDDELHHVYAMLRSRQTEPMRRYYLWNDADTLLESDITAFGRLVHALCSVAAEHEYLDDDNVIIERAIFLGGPKLGAYAEEPQGQFAQWRTDDPGGARLDEIQASLARPPVITFRVDG